MGASVMQMVREIAFLNRGVMDPADFAFAVEAIRIQYERDFYPIWADYLPVKRPCVVVGYTDATNLAPGSFAPIEIVHALDRPEYRGDHGGFALTDSAWGRSQPDPSVMSHEALELGGDPYGDRWIVLPSGIITPLEVVDGVQNRRYSITATIGGVSRDVEVSNFLCPAWFGEGVGRLDFMGTCEAPGDYSNGYIVIENADKTTTNVFGALATPEYRAQVNAKKDDQRSRTTQRHVGTSPRVYITPGVMGPMEWTAPT